MSDQLVKIKDLSKSDKKELDRLVRRSKKALKNFDVCKAAFKKAGSEFHEAEQAEIEHRIYTGTMKRTHDSKGKYIG